MTSLPGDIAAESVTRSWLQDEEKGVRRHKRESRRYCRPITWFAVPRNTDWPKLVMRAEPALTPSWRKSLWEATLN